MENLSSAIYLAVTGACRWGGREPSGTGIDPRHIKATYVNKKGCERDQAGSIFNDLPKYNWMLSLSRSNKHTVEPAWAQIWIPAWVSIKYIVAIKYKKKERKVEREEENFPGSQNMLTRLMGEFVNGCVCAGENA